MCDCLIVHSLVLALLVPFKLYIYRLNPLIGIGLQGFKSLSPFCHNSDFPACRPIRLNFTFCAGYCSAGLILSLVAELTDATCLLCLVETVCYYRMQMKRLSSRISHNFLINWLIKTIFQPASWMSLGQSGLLPSVQASSTQLCGTPPVFHGFSFCSR